MEAQKVITLDDEQAAAVDMCLDVSKRLVAISGLAGTGKTTIIQNVFERLRDIGHSVVLAAPTGKAARRITEATGIPAVTVHKMLAYNRPGERDEETGKALDVTRPKYDRTNRLPYQFIIVDEYAMINHELHNNILAALGPGACVRAFGDINQLPPIEEYRVTNNDGSLASTPFKKLLQRPDCVILDTVYRQDENSNVLEAANKIRKGHTPPVNKDLGDFQVSITDRPVELLKQYVKQSLDRGVNFRDINNQIIVPTKKSWVGTNKLNVMLRTLLNPNPEQTLELERHKWDKDRCVIGINDKVVCTSNTYDMRSFNERFEEFRADGSPILHSYIPVPPTKQMLNGETGVVNVIHPDGSLEIDFGDRIVEVPIMYEEWWATRSRLIDVCPMRDLDLAYALTTHKCQGSEYDEVIYVLNKSSIFTQSRQNFYTAVTRAAKRVCVLADQRSLRVSLAKVVV